MLVMGDFDADGATSTALIVRALRSWGFPARRLPGAEPLRVRLRTHAGNRRAGGAARSRADRHGRQRHFQPCRRRCGARRRHRRTDHRSSFAGRVAAAGQCHRQSQRAGQPVCQPGAGRRRCGLLRHGGAAPAARAAGMLPADALSAADLLDLVALGTVADVVPFDANNRILVAQGLAAHPRGPLRTRHPGAAWRSRGASAASLVASDLGFAVAPRLNAAGRLTDMSIGIRCLLADDPAEARTLALELDALNTERRSIEARMQAEARAAVRCAARSRQRRAARRACACSMPAGIRASSDWWRAASRSGCAARSSHSRRPSRHAARLGAFHSRRPHPRRARCDRGARRLADPQIRRPRDGCGLTLPLSALDAFARAFDAECARALGGAARRTSSRPTASSRSQELALPTAQALRDGGPWGPGFPEPLFDGVFRIQGARVVGERHLKLGLRAPGGPRAVRRHRVQLHRCRTNRRHCRAACAAGLSARQQRVPGRAAAAVRDRAPAAGLSARVTIHADGSQPAQAYAQRSRGTCRLLEGVSLSTIARKNASKK